MRDCDGFLTTGERVLARLGLVSDTHAPQRCPELPKAMFEALRGVDAILHGGDVGDLRVLDELAEVAPVVAVHGNDETHEAQVVLPEHVLVHAGGLRVMLTHTHQVDARFTGGTRPDDWPTMLAQRRPLAGNADVLVFGHLHVPMTRTVDDVLFVNPGIVGHSHVVLRSTVRSIALLFVTDGGPRVVHVDVETGEPFEPTVDWDGGYWATMDRINASIVDPALGTWREFWRTLRDVDKNATWNALLACANDCWTGRAEVITAETVLSRLRAGDLDRAVLERYEGVLLG